MGRAICVLLACALLAAASGTQEQKAIFRSGVQTVMLHATVRSNDGRLVPDLTRDDFAVRDEGQPVDISIFSSDPQPITAVLLLDMSGSMGRHFVRVRQSTGHFVDALLPGDRARIGSFGVEVALSPWLTDDKQVLHRIVREELWPGGGTPLWNALFGAMTSLGNESSRREGFISSLNAGDRVMIATCCGRTSFGKFRTARDDVREEVRTAPALDDDEGFGGSPIWDAMHEAITILARQPVPRALILMSDGRSSGNRYGLSDVADHAMTNGVSVNVIAKHSAQHVYQAGDTVAIVQPATPLEGVTRYTGGFLFTYPERRQEDARAMFGFAASLLRGLHAFSFATPVSDGKPHRLEIRSKTTGVKVHAPIAFVARSSRPG